MLAAFALPKRDRSLGERASRRLSAGGVLFDERGRVALVLQRDRALRLRWTFPKGRLDPDETIEAAALREVCEETGLRARITGYIARHDGARRSIHYFRMIISGRLGRHDKETEEVRLVSPGTARRMLRSARDRAVLEHALVAEQRATQRRSTVASKTVLRRRRARSVAR